MHKRLIPLTLAFVGDENPIDGRTRLQKMVFVVQQELVNSGHLNENQLYEFFAYDYGPFSKELAEDIDQMIEARLLDEEEVEYDDDGNIKYLYNLEPDGRELVEQELTAKDVEKVVEKATQIKERFNGDLSLPEVIDEVYAEYPEYAENSVY
ncbi:hypothetical protein C5B91_20935 [Haloferax sp. Atlit-10N]|uniref:hypothetical protein n=1 Tax=Haloferax sp. Atlit-10N TaxID=2077204 RepID=UPI000E39EC3A|nr:hypothetical protein [Haloferax sp. Atlit-10N]RDZ53390.1 hypothetical protein C5B91_20935 [Haloferax sp. Atlit-10N]